MTLGDEYLLRASETELFLLAVGPAVAGGLTGGIAIRLFGSAALGSSYIATISVGAFSGGVGGLTEYITIHAIANTGKLFE